MVSRDRQLTLLRYLQPRSPIWFPADSNQKYTNIVLLIYSKMFLINGGNLALRFCFYLIDITPKYLGKVFSNSQNYRFELFSSLWTHLFSIFIRDFIALANAFHYYLDKCLHPLSWIRLEAYLIYWYLDQFLLIYLPVKKLYFC